MFHYLTKVKGLPPDSANSPLMVKWRPRMDDTWREFMEITDDEVGL
jgi:hypothetical protein